VIALKLPIGLGILVLIGLFLFFVRRLPSDWNVSLSIVLAASLLFLPVLALGSTYGGIRHALPVVVLLSIFGGVAVQLAFVWKSKLLKAAVATALAVAAASALPVLRPWEDYNEIIGGTKNGYLYFSDEDIDVGQRGKELATYYHQILEPTAEVPLYAYGNGTNESELNARHVDWLGRDPQRDKFVSVQQLFRGLF
jgi:hypothetical protein